MFSLVLFRWLLLICCVAEFSCQPPSSDTHHTESDGIAVKQPRQIISQKEFFEAGKVLPEVLC